MKKLTVMGFVLSFLFGSAAWGIGDTPTSPCLGTPHASAEFWVELFPPEFEGPFPNPATDCPVVCAMWVTTCKGIAKTAHTCLTRSFNNIEKLWTEECKTIVDPDEKTECVTGVKEESKEFKDEVKEDLVWATDFCNGEEATCVAECLDAHLP